ncbi:MAG: hypothetical protein GXP25_04895, partial [Planctomycetes bacterium]|nr:hypothetical protein [Planctomycetota bacterium]
MTNCILAGDSGSAYSIQYGYNVHLQHVIIGHGTYGLLSYWTGQCEDVIFFGLNYGFSGMDSIEISGAEFRNSYYGIYVTGHCAITDGVFSGNVKDIYLSGGNADLRYCDPTTVVTTSTRGKTVWIRSQDHGRVLGAAKTWVGTIGTIERQNTVARSGYAAECTPDVLCSSDNPLEIEWDIPCTHGDVITATVYVRVNSTYGITHDPDFILDPDSLYGCNDTASEDITAADTWTQLSVTGTADLGGAG